MIQQPKYLAASVQDICRGYGPCALMRDNQKRVLLIGEQGDANASLRHALEVLPIYYTLTLSTTKGKMKWLRKQITR